MEELKGEKFQLDAIESKTETPFKEVSNISFKFWQTPSASISSPFTPNSNPKDQNVDLKRAGKPLSKEFEDFLNKDTIWEKELENMCTSKLEEENLYLLTEELFQVFSFENIDKSTKAHKEDLIHKVLKLGGDNYTCEDLRKDLLNIENEDKNNTLPMMSENGIDIEQGEKAMGKERKRNSDPEMVNQSGLINQILRELENEDTKGEDSIILNAAQNAHNNMEQLGIQMNQEGLNSPKCRKVKVKRGRKSLKELREVDGHNREQQKIDQLFKNRMGKCLSKDT